MPVRIIRDQSGADYHAEKFHNTSTYIKDWGLRSPAHAEHGEKTKPFAAQHFVMEPDVLAIAEERVEQIMLEIAHSRETGVFSTGWPPVSKINLLNTEF